MHKEGAKEKARELRNQGLTYSEIGKLLNASKSTIRLWTSDIQLSPEQQAKIKNKVCKNLTYTGSPKGKKSRRRLEMGEIEWHRLQEEKLKSKQQKSYQKRKLLIRIHNVNYKKNLKLRLIAYKGGKCEICGYSKKCPTVYHFHHTDSSQKEFGISQARRKYKEQDLFKEVDKCQLLCSNCHSEIHDLLYQKQREETVKKLKAMMDSAE